MFEDAVRNNVKVKFVQEDPDQVTEIMEDLVDYFKTMYEYQMSRPSAKFFKTRGKEGASNQARALSSGSLVPRKLQRKRRHT